MLVITQVTQRQANKFVVHFETMVYNEWIKYMDFNSEMWNLMQGLHDECTQNYWMTSEHPWFNTAHTIFFAYYGYFSGLD